MLVGWSVGRLVLHLLFRCFASGFCITAPAQLYVSDAVMYTAPHHRPCPTARALKGPKGPEGAWGCHHFGPIEHHWIGRVFSTPYCPWPIHYRPCPTASNWWLHVYGLVSGHIPSMMHVHQRNLTTIDKLKETIEDIMHTIPEEMVWDAVANLPKRC